MKRAQVQMPDALYQEVERLAVERNLSVSDLLRIAAEKMVHHQPKKPTKHNGAWQFPEGRHLGNFCAPVLDWRLLANEIE